MAYLNSTGILTVTVAVTQDVNRPWTAAMAKALRCLVAEIEGDDGQPAQGKMEVPDGVAQWSFQSVDHFDWKGVRLEVKESDAVVLRARVVPAEAAG